MITVGLIKEFFYISTVLNVEINATLQLKFPLIINIKNGFLKLTYNDFFIWEENVEGETSFFGIESCDSISRIIACMDNDDENWKRYCFFESSK